MGMYDRQAGRARREAKRYMVLVLFDAVFVVVNIYCLLLQAQSWPLNFSVVVICTAMGVWMFGRSVQCLAVAKRWDDLSVEHGRDL